MLSLDNTSAMKVWMCCRTELSCKFAKDVFFFVTCFLYNQITSLASSQPWQQKPRFLCVFFFFFLEARLENVASYGTSQRLRNLLDKQAHLWRLTQLLCVKMLRLLLTHASAWNGPLFSVVRTGLKSQKSWTENVSHEYFHGHIRLIVQTSDRMCRINDPN